MTKLAVLITYAVCCVGGDPDGRLLVGVDLLHEDVPVVAGEVELGGLVAQACGLLRHPDVGQNATEPPLQGKQKEEEKPRK